MADPFRRKRDEPPTRPPGEPPARPYKMICSGRVLGSLLILLPVGLTLLPLPGQWNPQARKEAWRETVAYLADYAQPEDAILIHPDWTRYPFQYYFQGPGQTYAVFSSVSDNTNLDDPLTTISQHPVVWLVESHTELADPEHRVNAWLAARYPMVTELYPPGLAAVHAYAPGYISRELPTQATAMDAVFGGNLALIGVEVAQARTRAGDELFHPPSAWVHVTLYWTLAQDPGLSQAAPFIHLVDDAGQVWGASLDRSNDAFDFYPPERWQPGQVVRTDLDVNLNPVTPPGEYRLVAGLRDENGIQLPLQDGSLQADIGRVEITGP